jgi:protein glucosyltransferase
LLANSTIFLSTIFIDRVTDLIKLYVHYVPFSLDISDLTDKLNYIYNNQALAKDIALKGTEFASQHLRIEDMQCYIAFLLMEYAQLLKP